MLKTLGQSTFLRHNAILFGGAMAVGVLNYAFYPVIGRLLEPAMFGEVQAVISLFLQLSMFLTVVNIVTVYIVANYGNVAKRNLAIYELEKLGLLVTAAILLAMIVFANQLRAFFHFESAWPFALLGVLLVLTVPFTFRTSYLRGKQKFMASTAAQLFAAAGKFVFSVPLILLGLGASGAIGGVAVAQAAALGYAAWRSKLAGLARPKNFKLFARPQVAQVMPEIKYSLFVLVGSLAIMLLLTVDTLAVKHFFDAHTAGLYAGVATASRIVFFVTASIAQALLPAIKVGAPPGKNRALLIKSLGLFGAAGLPVLVLFWLWPQQSLTVLMGREYAELAALLPLLTLTVFIIALLNLIVSYFLTLKTYIVGMFAIIGFAAALVTIVFHHRSPQAIVEALWLGSMVSMCLIAIWFARSRLDRRSIDETTTTLHRGSGT